MHLFVAGEADNNHVFLVTRNDVQFITMHLVFKNYIKKPMNFRKNKYGQFNLKT